MAIRKKGSRRIIVDGVEYRWYIRRKPSYGQLIDGGIAFAVECISNEQITTLVVTTPYDRPDSIGKHPAIIQPSDVAEAIRSALKAGWGSFTGPGPFQFEVDVGNQI